MSQDFNLTIFKNTFNKYPVLPEEAQKRLIKKAQNGNVKALKYITLSNLKFVIAVALNYQNSNMNMLELINEGFIGISKAVFRYDRGKNIKFITYAVWWIRQSITSKIYSYNHLCRLPLNVSNDYNQIKKADTNLLQVLHREPSSKDLMDATGIQEQKIEDIYLAIKSPVLLSHTEKTDLNQCIKDKNAKSDLLYRLKSFKIKFEKIIQTLSTKEQKILSYYFFDNLSLEEIGHRFNLSKEMIRLIKNKAINKLKQKDINHRLKEIKEELEDIKL